MKRIILIAIAIQLSFVAFSQSDNEILNGVLSEIKLIKSASYYEKSSASAPYDTLMAHTYERLVKMYTNPEDTFIGAGYSTAFIEDSLKYYSCYDGNFSISFNWENYSVNIDTLIGNDIYRPVSPFFIYAKFLLEYTVNNLDSAQVLINDFQDSLRIKIKYKNMIVEFFNRIPQFHYGSEFESNYTIWIDKENDLPFKIERDMTHQKSIRYVSDVKYSSVYPEKFIASTLIPAGFKINNEENNEVKTYELIGKSAPNWKLESINGDSLALNEVKSKIILIQFTGGGCGPCHASVPFIKELIEENQGKDIEVLRIEAYGGIKESLQYYQNKNGLNCRYLLSNKELNKKYEIIGVPTIFILDEKRIIRNVFIGFKKDETEQVITDALNQLL